VTASARGFPRFRSPIMKLPPQKPWFTRKIEYTYHIRILYYNWTDFWSVHIREMGRIHLKRLIRTDHMEQSGWPHAILQDWWAHSSWAPDMSSLWGTNQQNAMETMSKNFATRWFISLMCDCIILLQFNHMCHKISSIDHKDLSFSSSAPWSLQLVSCACAAAPRDGRPKRVDVQRTRSGLRRTSPRKMWNN